MYTVSKPQSEDYPVAEHSASIAQRVQSMAEIITEARGMVVFRNIIAPLINGTVNGGPDIELQAIYDYVKEKIRFVRDPRGIDYIYDPVATLQRGIGDCDDHVVVLGSLVQAIGYPIKIRAISLDGRHYTHVYVLAGVMDADGGMWIPMDTVFADGYGCSPESKVQMELVI